MGQLHVRSVVGLFVSVSDWSSVHNPDVRACQRCRLGGGIEISSTVERGSKSGPWALAFISQFKPVHL
jgi:hypothetical protein